jgi:hypothetical protein
MVQTTRLVSRHLGVGIREDMGTGVDGRAEILAAATVLAAVLAEVVEKGYMREGGVCDV